MIASIRDQEKLTPELEQQIRAAATLVAVEDVYRPYKPKRRTRATIAKEKGLEPLADLIFMQMAKEPLEKAAAPYIAQEKVVETVEEARSLSLIHISRRQGDRHQQGRFLSQRAQEARLAEDLPQRSLPLRFRQEV